MDIKTHAIGSAVAGGAAYALTSSAELAIWILVSGIGIDLDHLIDYKLEYRQKSFSPSHFMETCNASRLEKTRLFLHSYEIIFILGAMAYFTREVWLIGICAGIGQHLLVDQMFNKTLPLTYFLSFRAKNGYHARKIFDYSKESVRQERG
ncbi:MAG: hypothetical protein JW803_09810 [Endomicrobiales bacterium]|nr:hypothetical protein [Endomicrobiales bacterium]